MRESLRRLLTDPERLRANVPTAVASTLVSNPVTFAPLYYADYRIGSAILGEGAPRQDAASAAPREPGFTGWLACGWDRIAALGMAVMATIAGLATWLWRLKVWWDWRRRGRR